MKKFIAVAGNMGVGKTSMVEFLCARYGVEAVYEPYTDNPYLDDFYQNMGQYAFHSQLYFLTHKFRLHMALNNNTATVVQDRTIYEDAVFAKMLVKLNLMDERDYENYLSLFRNMSNFMCRPNVIVYLDVKPERSMERIRERSRDVESGISLEYLTALYDGYEEFVSNISRTIPVIRVDWDRFRDVDDIASRIEEEYLRGSFLREVNWEPTRG